MNKDQLVRAYQASLARDRMLYFMQYCWRSPSKPMCIGRHTREITDRLDKAIADYRNGISTYLIVTVPPRHGKSEIISRNFPPYFFGHFPDAEIMLATYAQELSSQMSRDARAIVRSEQYQSVFYDKGITVSSESSSVQNWEIAGHRGKFQAFGIGGSSTGKGADVLILDDYLKGRSDAESRPIRNTIWDDFSGNLMTRLAPVHIVIILATRWHVDDIIGRCLNRMTPGNKDYDEEFPKFEVMKFPARDVDGNYLFPERFPESWYRNQFASLGKYQSAALMQCEPTMRGGNMLQVDGVQIIDPDKWPKNLRYVRFWDLASSEKERAKDDPDFTSGAKVAVTKENGLYKLWVDDVRYCQSEAPDRDSMIERTSNDDGPGVHIYVESVGGYKDTFTTLKKVLDGKRIIHKVTVSRDKVVRAGEMEPLFPAGHVYFKRGWWNDSVLEQLQEFPAGMHDDHVDAIAGGYIAARKALWPSSGVVT